MSLLEQASLVVTPNGYKASKLYSVIPSTGAGDMNVVRATTATRVNSAGLIESVAVNVPRIDYTNGSCPSLLVEGQRTNLLLRSQEFDNGVWELFNSPTITANTTISPDGTQNADTITFSVNGSSLVYQNYIGLSNTYTISVYAKSSTNKKFCFRNFGGSGVIRSADFTTTNEWQKFTYTFTDTLINVSICNESAGGVGSIDVWGAQLEVGSYATSYIPTVASTVTRNGDVISKTGISSLIGQTEGTIFFDGKINALPVDGSLFGIQKNASNFVIRFGSQGTNIYAQSYNGSANLFFETTPYTLGSRVKAAFAYKAGSYAFYINGVQIATGSNATAIPACDATMFNSLWGNFTDALSFYSASGLWKTRLTNAELIELTTL
jgi:hypothetical protein